MLESVKCVFSDWLVCVRWLTGVCCLSTASEYKHPKSFSWDKYMEETGTQAAPARAFKPVTHTDRQTKTNKTHTHCYLGRHCYTLCSYLGSYSHIAMPTFQNNFIFFNKCNNHKGLVDFVVVSKTSGIFSISSGWLVYIPLTSRRDAWPPHWRSRPEGPKE